MFHSLMQLFTYILILPPGLHFGYDDFLSIVYHLFACVGNNIITIQTKPIHHKEIAYHRTFIDVSHPKHILYLRYWPLEPLGVLVNQTLNFWEEGE